MRQNSIPNLYTVGQRVLYQGELYTLIHLDSEIALSDGDFELIQVAFISKQEASTCKEAFTLHVVPAEMIEATAGNDFWLVYMGMMASRGF